MANTSPGAQQNPLYCMLAGALNVSFDGGATWTPIGGSGGGVTSIVAGTNVTVSGATGAVTVNAASQFGQDTTVSINNSAASPVTALELIASLTTNTAGSEASQWLTKLLSAGAEVTSRIDRPGSAWFPNGTQALPGVAFLGTALDGTTGKANGMLYDQGLGLLELSVQGGTGVASLDNASHFTLWGGLARLILSSSSQDVILQRNSSTDMQLQGGHDVVIGADGALATNATQGFLEIPTCAGTPTGIVTVRTGKACIVYDTTNLKLALSVGGGTWKQTAALT